MNIHSWFRGRRSLLQVDARGDASLFALTSSTPLCVWGTLGLAARPGSGCSTRTARTESSSMAKGVRGSIFLLFCCAARTCFGGETVMMRCSGAVDAEMCLCLGTGEKRGQSVLSELLLLVVVELLRWCMGVCLCIGHVPSQHEEPPHRRLSVSASQRPTSRRVVISSHHHPAAQEVMRMRVVAWWMHGGMR
jgi:hypothetical protein